MIRFLILRFFQHLSFFDLGANDEMVFNGFLIGYGLWNHQGKWNRIWTDYYHKEEEFE